MYHHSRQQQIRAKSFLTHMNMAHTAALIHVSVALRFYSKLHCKTIDPRLMCDVV